MATPKIIKAQGLYASFDRKAGSAPGATHYCAGCGHGVLHKLIGEAMADLDLQDQTVLISPVGCAVFAYYYLDCGNVQAAHGRAPALGAAIRRSAPHSIVISYQGDGDLCSIGWNQTFQAANRGDCMAVFFVNNAVYGMTGGQMAPTTLVGQRTATTPRGRTAATEGYPIHACEALNVLPAPVYIERCSLADSKRVQRARKAVRKALQIQKDGKGYAFVEFLSPCPTNMKSNAVAAAQFVTDEMEQEFPLGCLRDRSDDVAPIQYPERLFEKADLDDMFFGSDIPPAIPIDTDIATCRIKVAGFGGQGVLSLGLMIAEAGQHAGCRVTWFPSYGPEQRGGTANCSVVLSGQEIGSPVVSEADVLIAMNQPSLERFASSVVPGGTIFYDASIQGVEVPENINALAVPAFDIAVKAGAAKAANTAMLGAIAASKTCPVPAAGFEAAFSSVLAGKPKVLAVNQNVFATAADWTRQQLQPA